MISAYRVHYLSSGYCYQLLALTKRRCSWALTLAGRVRRSRGSAVVVGFTLATACPWELSAD